MLLLAILVNAKGRSRVGWIAPRVDPTTGQASPPPSDLINDDPVVMAPLASFGSITHIIPLALRISDRVNAVSFGPLSRGPESAHAKLMSGFLRRLLRLRSV